MIDEKKLIEKIVNTPTKCMKEYSVSCIEEAILYGSASRQLEILDIINKQPKADWIPCSERLPSGSGLYLATYECEDEITVDVMFFVGKQFYYPEDMIGNAVKSVEVIAWQRLPEPYKEGEI